MANIINKRGGTVDMTGIGRQIAKMPKFKRAAMEVANRQVKIEKEKMLEEFSSHPVTREIEGGKNAENISNTLGGAGSDSNLSTFIGFPEMGSPTSSVKAALNNGIRVSSVSTRGYGRGGERVAADVRVEIPTEKDLKSITQLPWEPGKSWLRGIEEGISGFGYYMYKKFLRGRSKFGLQSKHRIRNSSFRPVPYFSSILGKFINRLRNLR